MTAADLETLPVVVVGAIVFCVLTRTPGHATDRRTVWYNPGVRVELRVIVKFGKPVTLYRIVAADRWSTPWCSTLDRAMSRYERHERRRLAHGG